MLLTVLLLLFLLGVVILCLVLSSAAWGFWRTRVPYVRSNRLDTEQLLSIISWKATDIFYDLGSGDGRVVFMVEEKGVKNITGFELTMWTYVQARIKKQLKRSRAIFKRKNFFNESWNDATVIYCYLYPPLMRSIEEKFLTECKPGTVLFSRDFPLPNVPPTQIVNFINPHSAYMYKK